MTQVRIHRPVYDPFFLKGNAAVIHPQKQTLWNDNVNKLQFEPLPTILEQKLSIQDKLVIHCGNTNACLCFCCKKIFPSNHFLDMHLTEVHDNFFKLLSEKQNMYRCFVKKCEEKFPNQTERKNHIVTIHKFPANFYFGQAVEKNCKLKQKKELPSCQQMIQIPKTVCFGHGVAKGFPIPWGKRREKAHGKKENMENDDALIMDS